jgi:uncharacterized membrane protein YhaH (DUF805 family)
LGMFSRVLWETAARLHDNHKPNPGEVYRAGRSIGLDLEDLSGIYSKNSLGSDEGFFSVHTWLAPLIVIGGIIIILLILLWWTGSPGPPRYGTVSPKDFKRDFVRRKNKQTHLDM